MYICTYISFLLVVLPLPADDSPVLRAKTQKSFPEDRRDTRVSQNISGNHTQCSRANLLQSY